MRIFWSAFYYKWVDMTTWRLRRWWGESLNLFPLNFTYTPKTTKDCIPATALLDTANEFHIVLQMPSIFKLPYLLAETDPRDIV